MDGTVFRIVSVPFDLTTARIGSLYLATALDRRYADDLGSAGRRADRDRERRPDRDQHAVARVGPRVRGRAGHARRPLDGIITLDGESHAFRRLVNVSKAGSTR